MLKWLSSGCSVTAIGKKNGAGFAHRRTGLLSGGRGKGNKVFAAEVRSSSGQEPAARRVGVRRDVCICWAFTRCVTVGKTGSCDLGWDTHLGGSKPVIFIAQSGRDSVLQG